MKMTRQEVAHLIRSFVGGSCGDWDWDNFISVRQRDKELEQIRQRALGLPEEFPPDKPSRWCNDEGIKVLLEIADLLSQVK